jgi:hypothetical protein
MGVSFYRGNDRDIGKAIAQDLNPIALEGHQSVVIILINTFC